MNAELEKATNQVYQKVGRNVVHFYKLEDMLKRLTASSQISGYVSEFQKKAQKQIESISKQTLGHVATKYIERISPGGDIDLGPDNPKEPWVSYGCKDSHEGTEERKKRISDLIEERNKLIHQFNQVCDLSTLDGCNASEAYLDRQYDSVIGKLRSLDCFAQARNIAAK